MKCHFFKKNRNILIGIFIGLIIVLLIFFTLNRFGFLSGKYFFPNKNENNFIIESTINNIYKTKIIHNHTYNNMDINNSDEAYKLIINDSIEQKTNCPKNIIEIENKIINEYKITSVNMCEIDYQTAKEINNILSYFNNNFPNTLNYITNISIANTNENYITKFIPFYVFTKSSNDSTFPWTIKTQILLNSKYFLNNELFEKTFKTKSELSFYPKNSTKTSIISHELGHFLSYLAIAKNNNLNLNILLNNSKINDYHIVLTSYENDKFFINLVAEAYEEYKKDTNTTMSLIDFRKSISNYAIEKNQEGNYIYSETIAEAFHDLYVNKNNASDASKYIIKSIKKYLEK